VVKLKKLEELVLIDIFGFKESLGDFADRSHDRFDNFWMFEFEMSDVIDRSTCVSLYISAEDIELEGRVEGETLPRGFVKVGVEELVANGPT